MVWQPKKSAAVFIIVTRVARDGSWADLRMFTWAVSWTRRMPMPMPKANIEFRKWDAEDLAKQADDACKPQSFGILRDGYSAA